MSILGEITGSSGLAALLRSSSASSSSQGSSTQASSDTSSSVDEYIQSSQTNSLATFLNGEESDSQDGSSSDNLFSSSSSQDSGSGLYSVFTYGVTGQVQMIENRIQDLKASEQKSTNSSK